MQIHRSNNGSPTPYNIRFEIDPYTNFSERLVARSALMGLSPFDCDRLGLEGKLVGKLAELGSHISKESTENIAVELSTLKIIGGMLAYYSDVTEEELGRIMSNNPIDKVSTYGLRRLEGMLADTMVTTIEARRIKVPRLWVPRVTPTVIRGFTR